MCCFIKAMFTVLSQRHRWIVIMKFVEKDNFEIKNKCNYLIKSECLLITISPKTKAALAHC